MHVKSLKVFCDVVARRSFSRAADENGITQSGASQVVNHLERHLGVKLIDRSKRPFVLTPVGALYYGGCREIVQRYFALEEEIRTAATEVAGSVRVASIYSVGFSHMNRFVDQFQAECPKASVRLQYEHPNRVYELVETDQADVGLVSYPRSSRTIEATLWREEPMVVVCAPGHPFVDGQKVTLGQLDGLAMVGFDRGLPIRREIGRALAGAGVDVDVVVELDNIETIKRAIEAGTGVGLLPEPTVAREVASGTLLAIPLADQQIVRPLGLICRRGKELTRTGRRFVQLLRDKADAPWAEQANGALAAVN
jgi:DNA-binding transcriptional LysR family regulator